MRIDVIGKGLDVSEALRSYAQGKTTKLTRYFERVQQITVSLIKRKQDHHDVFEAELVVDVEHHDDFVSRATADDLYAAIDLVAEKGERQLRDFKEQLKQKH